MCVCVCVCEREREREREREMRVTVRSCARQLPPQLFCTLNDEVEVWDSPESERTDP